MQISFSHCNERLSDQKVFLFKKNLYGRYLECNPRFAMLSGLSTCQEINGLTDYDLPWATQAQFFQMILDYVVSWHDWTNRFQQLVTSDKCQNILISVVPTVDERGVTNGIIGSFIDMADIKPATYFEGAMHASYQPDKQPFTNLSKSERRVLQALLSGKSNDEIGRALFLAKRTIDGYVENLKEKLACTSKSELIAYAYSSGLAYFVNK